MDDVLVGNLKPTGSVQHYSICDPLAEVADRSYSFNPLIFSTCVLIAHDLSPAELEMVNPLIHGAAKGLNTIHPVICPYTTTERLDKLLLREFYTNPSHKYKLNSKSQVRSFLKCLSTKHAC